MMVYLVHYLGGDLMSGVVLSESHMDVDMDDGVPGWKFSIFKKV